MDKIDNIAKLLGNENTLKMFEEARPKENREIIMKVPEQDTLEFHENLKEMSKREFTEKELEEIQKLAEQVKEAREQEKEELSELTPEQKYDASHKLIANKRFESESYRDYRIRRKIGKRYLRDYMRGTRNNELSRIPNYLKGLK